MRTAKLIGLGALAIGLALWLRGAAHTELHGSVTQALGHEGRAMLEHGLLGFGVTLLVPLLILAARWLAEKARARPADPSSVETTSSAPALDDFAQPKWVFMGSMLVGLFYIAGALGHEWMHAYVGLGGEPARGGVGRNPLVADVLSVVAATSVARWVARRN